MTAPTTLPVDPDRIAPGELVRWRGNYAEPVATLAGGSTEFVGYLAGDMGETLNCVEADGTAHSDIPRDKVSRR